MSARESNCGPSDNNERIDWNGDNAIDSLHLQLPTPDTIFATFTDRSQVIQGFISKDITSRNYCISIMHRYEP